MPQSNANANCNVDTYGHRDSLAYTNGNIYSYSNSDCDSYIHTYSYGNIYAYPNADANCDLRPIHDQSDRRQHRAWHGGHWQSLRRLHDSNHAAIPLHAIRSDVYDCECGLQRHTAICECFLHLY
jgi:hypothetical protein